MRHGTHTCSGMSLLVRWSEPIVLFINMSLSPVVTPFDELKWITRFVTDLYVPLGDCTAACAANWQAV